MSTGEHVNDLHSELNATHVAAIVKPASAEETIAHLRQAHASGRAVSLCGARHAMVGQQFGAGTLLLDLRRLTSIGRVDRVRGLIDAALAFGGSYFLTCHRWARREQVERAYPQFAEFLRRKETHDPAHRFPSDWWRHNRAMFAAS